ncbi:MAG: GNAT family protein [Anderseniella sp.]|nr:GNAT family protein [Anderseniella sp.]
MIDGLETALQRNIGNTLTPELAAGILYASGPDHIASGVPFQVIDCTPKLVGASNSQRRVFFDRQDEVAAWVAERIDCDPRAWAGYVTLAIEDDKGLLAGVVLEGFTGTNANIHVAGVGRHWLNRQFLMTVFEFAFRQLGLLRLTGLVDSNNEDAIRFDLHLGFEVEAVLKGAVPNGDLLVLVMRPEQCRYLRSV